MHQVLDMSNNQKIKTTKRMGYKFSFETRDEYFDYIGDILNNGCPDDGCVSELGEHIEIQSFYNTRHQATQLPATGKPQVYPEGYDIAPNTGNRKGPTQSASQTDEGVMTIGNDGSWWRITKSESGIKKWKKMKSEPISAVIPITDLTQFELLEKQKEKLLF